MSTDVNPLVTQRETFNPYFFCGAQLVKRMLWDLSYESWRSRSLLKSWKNTHQGKAVILCNGPSLLKVDFQELADSGVFCFGLNKINLLFDKTPFRPSCIVAVNPLVIDQNVEFYNETPIPLFLDRHGVGLVHRRPNVAFLHSIDIPRFAKDCSMSIFQGYTVTYVALQLAFHMGFREVALVGADHNFATKGPANMTVVSEEKDESHFDPRYFAGGVKWQLPDLFQSEVAYTMARDMYAAYGGQVVNATVGGKLEVFERQALSEFLKR